MNLRVPLFIFLAIFCLGSDCEQVPLRQWERENYHPVSENIKQWALPNGLETRSIIGYENELETSLLPLAFTVINTTSNRINTVLPAGLVFEPANLDYQYMLILQPVVVTVPPDMDTTYYLPTFCANEMLDEPDMEASYSIVGREWEVEMNELVELLQGKTVAGYNSLDLVQEALFEITDGDGLTDTMRTQLQNLP